MIDPTRFPTEHPWAGPEGEGRRCRKCWTLWGEHYWPWDSRGG